jgi:hypothetical protein
LSPHDQDVLLRLLGMTLVVFDQGRQSFLKIGDQTNKVVLLEAREDHQSIVPLRTSWKQLLETWFPRCNDDTSRNLVYEWAHIVRLSYHVSLPICRPTTRVPLGRDVPDPASPAPRPIEPGTSREASSLHLGPGASPLARDDPPLTETACSAVTSLPSTGSVAVYPAHVPDSVQPPPAAVSSASSQHADAAAATNDLAVASAVAGTWEAAVYTSSSSEALGDFPRCGPW